MECNSLLRMDLNTRSARILASAILAKEDSERLEFLGRPFYETTRGTNSYEKNQYLEAIQNDSPKNAIIQLDEVTSSCIKNRAKTRNVLNDHCGTSEVVCIEKNNYVSSNIESDHDPYSDSEDEEYVPSSLDSDSSSEEILSQIDEREVDFRKNDVPEHFGNKQQGNNLSKKSFIEEIATKKYQNNEASISSSLTNMEREHANKNENEVTKCNREDEIRDATVKVSVLKRDGDGKRFRDKMHCCYICNKFLTNNMARHYELRHSDDLEVAKILALPKKSQSRRDGFENLIRAGDFYHNCSILSNKEGELILVRRPESNSHLSYADFGPCPYCLGFMAKRYLWHHFRQCKMKKNNLRTQDSEVRRGPLHESSALLFDILGPTTEQDFRKVILASFRSDPITEVCKEDMLILRLGAFLYEKYGTRQSELIRQSMRQLSRLKIGLGNTFGTLTLSELIKPKYFDDIIKATKSLCGNDINHLKELNSFKVPSVALKIGHLLRKCIALESGAALRKGLIGRHKELKAFSELMDLEWSVRISSKALSALHQKKINTAQLLPLTSELLKLNLHLQSEIKLLKLQVRQNCTRQLWNKLASVTLSRIILFNKRRSGEAARMTLNNYSTRPAWSEQGTEEFKNSLTSLETELANRLMVVEIMGKRGRIVPVILTEEMKSSIDILIEYREKGDININNTYIFARSQESEGFLRGHDCLRKECSNAGLTNAGNITSTKLRKYIATVCQIFNLTENESDWLARHLGHDIRVHREFYRMHESAVELTKVSRLLLAVDKGEAGKYSGKKLDEINIEELPPMDEDDDIHDEDERMENECIENESPLQDFMSGEAAQKRSKMSAPNKGKKIPWTKEELACVHKYFSRFINRESIPGKKDCEECIENNQTLSRRKWTDVKYCIKNQITKNLKMKTTNNSK